MRKLIVACVLVVACGFSGWARNDDKLTWLEANELKCLVDNIYYEARGEPLEGQIAVARVVLNRVGVWAPTVCKVVYQPHQFSWTSNKIKLLQDRTAYEVAWRAAWMSRNYSLTATHYHSLKVSPKWAKSLTKPTTIGNHVFYYSN